MAEKASTPKKAEAPGVSKMEAVRQAIASLGSDAGRSEIQTFIKKRLGFEMGLDIISTYKADIARKAALTKSAAKKPAPPAPAAAAKLTAKAAPPAAMKKPATTPAVAKKPAPVPQALATSAAGNGKAGGLHLTDIQAVKDLVGRVGPSSLKALVDVLTK